MPEDIQPGQVGWVDLTVDNAADVRDFYRAVVGWEYREVEMDGYSDYAMTNLEGNDVTGICHAKGANEGLPAQWLVYFTVLDLQFAVDEAVANGGEILRAPTDMGAGQFAVIRDPAGAVCALFEPAPVAPDGV
jgi:predicted enzyme related to lactoylglutathione lyase